MPSIQRVNVSVNTFIRRSYEKLHVRSRSQAVAKFSHFSIGDALRRPAKTLCFPSVITLLDKTVLLVRVSVIPSAIEYRTALVVVLPVADPNRTLKKIQINMKKLLATTSAITARLLSVVNKKIAIVGLLAASIVAAGAANYTTGTTNGINLNGKTILEATGNSMDVTTFSNSVATAFANDIGGAWNFEGTSFGLNVGDTITLNYGAALTNSLVLTLSSGNSINQAANGGEATSGGFVLGLGGDASTRVFTPDKPLLAVGIFNTDRNDAGRVPALTVTYLDNTTASTSGANADNVYFHCLSGTGANPIVKFEISQNNFIRYDDLAFLVSTQSLSPQITTQPASQSIYQNEDLALSATAVGANLAYQWKAGAPSSGIYTNVPGATGASLSVPWIQASADYILIVTNTSGSATSDVAAVTVVAPTYVNGLFNGDFELPGTGKINAGFDVAGANNVPGWRNAGANQNDTGIESAGSGHTGSYAAYLHRGQSGAYQITTNVLQQGDSVTLTWYERDSYFGVNRNVSLLSASAQTNAFNSTTILTAVTNEVTGGWTQKTLSYVAGAGDAGKLLGVAFQSADPATATGWANFDDFGITITPAAAAPVIVTPPGNQTAYLAANVTFTVVASGSGLNYQWQSGAVGSGIYTNVPNGGQHTGANAASLIISNITTDNGLDYVVIVSNTGGSVTSTPPATLTVDTNAPGIWSQPASRTNFNTTTATFTVGTWGAVGYQWLAGAVGSGIYTNLFNGGQFSGVNTATLTVTNVQEANQADYVVVVTNGGGSITSAPAALTVFTTIYSQDFETSTNLITAVGWAADSTSGQAVLGAPYWGGKSIFDAEGTNLPLAYYTSTAINNGSIPGKMAFPSINLATVSNLVFYTDVQSYWNPASEHTYFIVQMNSGPWYASATELTTATGGQEKRTMSFDTNAAAWKDLTVTGTGGTTNATIGAAATTDLSGSITGAGLVTVHDSSSWINLDNFAITGSGFTAVPLVNTTPTNLVSSITGGTLSLSWPADRTGWRLTTQTNTRSVGLQAPTNLWFTVPGSTASNSMSIAIDPTQPTVFFRLTYP